MNNNFILYPEALDLKELRFDDGCLGYFDVVYEPFTQSYDGNLILGKDPDHLKSQKQLNYIFGQQKILAPLYSQAFKFFRDKYGLIHSITFNDTKDNKVENSVFFDIEIYKLSQGDVWKEYKKCEFTDNYEEAELACLKKLIELCKKYNKKI